MICALTAALLCVGASAMTTKVDAKTEWCFREDVSKDIPLRFLFQVTAGGKMDIDASVYDGSGRKLHSWHGVTEGHYEAHGDASNNKFRFCFSNKMSHFTPKWVSFFTHKGVHPNVANVEHLDPIEQQILEINRMVGDLRDSHDQLRVEEREHRATIEDANERVWLWSGVEAFALLFMGVLQIFFLKRFLEVRSSV